MPTTDIPESPAHSRARFSWVAFGAGALAGIIAAMATVVIVLSATSLPAAQAAPTLLATPSPSLPRGPALGGALGATDNNASCAVPKQALDFNDWDSEPPVCGYDEDTFASWVYVQLYYYWASAAGFGLDPDLTEHLIRTTVPPDYLLKQGKRFVALGTWERMTASRDARVDELRNSNLFWNHTLLKNEVEEFMDSVMRSAAMYLRHDDAGHATEPVRGPYDEAAYLTDLRAALHGIAPKTNLSDSTLLGLGKRLAAAGSWDKMMLTRDKWVANAVDNYTFDDATKEQVDSIFLAMVDAAARHLLK